MRRRRVPVPTRPPIKSPVAVPIHGVCVACGGKNVIRFSRQPPLVQCRACGVVSPDFNQQEVASGFKDGLYEPLDLNDTHAMADELLDALSHESVKVKLQTLLSQAHGDVALICHFYVPYVLDVWATVVCMYGFSSSVEGVKESVRLMQRHATTEDSGLLTQKLIRLQRALSPTGGWIKEDAAADADDAKKQKEDHEQQLRKQKDAQRMEELAVENAKKARLRAKKIALGLDPTVPRLPQLDSEPPRVVTTHLHTSVHLRVVARFTLQFQWFFNGKPLPADTECVDLYRGVNRSSLVIFHLTKRTAGEYYCVCTNEEGAVSSSTTQVRPVALASHGLTTRKMKTLPSGKGTALVPLLPTVTTTATATGVSSKPPLMAATCVGGSLLLLHPKTLVPLKTLPPITPTNPVISTAWLPATKVLVVATQSRSMATAGAHTSELILYSLDQAPTASTAPALPTSKAPTKHHAPTNSGNHRLVGAHTTTASSSSTAATSTAPPAAPPSVILARQLATHRVLCSAQYMHFLEDGQILLVSDFHLSVQLYAMSPTFSCIRTLRFEPAHPICHIAPTTFTGHTSKDPFTGVSLCFRACAHVELVGFNTTATTKIECLSPVHRTAFDVNNTTLAVAEFKCMKAWVSIRSVRTSTSTSTMRTSSKRFVAHVGKISAMQWTTNSSLLLTGGHDGYVKLWDPEAGPVCVFCVHLDFRGIHSLVLLDTDGDRSNTSCVTTATNSSSDPVVWLAMGFSDCRLHAREFIQLRDFEATRRVERNRTASQIQKIWKGRRTRQLINQFIKPAI